MSEPLVLVTGGSGFIGGHCILELLRQGYRVRTTVRSLGRAASVRQVLGDAGMTAGELGFAAADLLSDEGRADAVAGCDYVLHVASPVHTGPVKDEDDVIRPAREGTLRVLRAARSADVRRVVLTSAFHAVGFGQRHDHGLFTEADWSPLDGPGMDAYGKSKVLSERAGWDFVASGGPELVTMLPVAVMGPVMGRDVSGANHIVQQALKGELPGFPNLWIPIVDVRDVAAAHVAALTAPGAAGGRILLAAGPSIPLRMVGDLLRANLGEDAAKVPARTLRDLLVRAIARFRPEFRSVAADLNFAKVVSSEKASALLGWRPRMAEEAVVAAGRSMIEKGLAP